MLKVFDLRIVHVIRHAMYGGERGIGVLEPLKIRKLQILPGGLSVGYAGRDFPVGPKATLVPTQATRRFS